MNAQNTSERIAAVKKRPGIGPKSPTGLGRVSYLMIEETRRRELEDFLHRQIPLTRSMQVKVETYDGRALVLSAPLSANHNHLGTAFGGSLAALMILAGYGLLWLELEHRPAHVVVRESTINFHRPVRGTIHATCHRPDSSVLEEFHQKLVKKGRARISLEVTIQDHDELAASLIGVFVAIAAS